VKTERYEHQCTCSECEADEESTLLAEKDREIEDLTVKGMDLCEKYGHALMEIINLKAALITAHNEAIDKVSRLVYEVVDDETYAMIRDMRKEI
jgi:hypothetical protein